MKRKTLDFEIASVKAKWFKEAKERKWGDDIRDYGWKHIEADMRAARMRKAKVRIRDSRRTLLSAAILEEEEFVLELAAIYGLDEGFMRALPVPTMEMWKMLVRNEVRRHKSERETMEKFRKELCDLKLGRVSHD